MKNQETSTALCWNYVAISFVIIVVFTLLVLYVPSMREIDGRILHSIRLALSPYPAYIPVFVSNFGRDYYMFWPQLVVASTLLTDRRFLKAGLFIGFVQLTYFLTNVFKNFVCRHRPSGSGYGFPSLHSSTTMCLYGIAIYLILHYVRSSFWRNLIAIVLGLWIFMCGLSRLWLGTDFLSDVITGMFFGFLFVNLYIIITRMIK